MLAALTLSAAGLAFAGPPPPPGGHIPIYFGGSNQAGYPPSVAGIEDAELVQAPALAAVSSSPNPFSGSTVVRFNAGKDTEIRLRVFDLTGREVRTFKHRTAAEGFQEIRWDGRDQNGKPLASGVYFYEIHAGKRSVTRKLALLR
jgi:hypothetical protein